MSARILIVGEGALADYVDEELSVQFDVIRQTDLASGLPKRADLALVLHDGWQPRVHQRAEELLQPAGIPWLRGFVSFGEGVIGPLVRPGTQGCSLCADMRRLMAGRDRREMQQLQRRLMELERKPDDAWASLTGLMHTVRLLTAEARGFLQGRPVLPPGHLFLINLRTLANKLHFFLPDPQCPACSRLPDDSSAAAAIWLQPSPKTGPDSYRSRSMEELKPVLTRDYLDERTGFLNGKMTDLESPFADVSVNLPLLSEDVGTAGRSHAYAMSELTAILEGLERHCGLVPRSKRTAVYGSFRELEEQALDPVKVGLHTREQYEQPGFPFVPFDPEQPLPWVWGYSFLQERPILVPEQLAYYGMGCGHRFVSESSNGCALGGTLEEAIFYGVLEVVERDSFLMTWYAQLPLPRLDPYSAQDKELSLMLDRMRAVAGFEVYLYNSTMEHGIPSVWAIAKNNKRQGVNLICAAGAHPDPVRAMKGAVHELAGMILNLKTKFEETRDTYIRMLHDSSLVQEMEDHAQLYALPEAEERLSFLLDELRPARGVEEEFKRRPEGVHADLTDDLKDMLAALRRLSLDVVAVDLSSPEMKRNGLHAVKVLIPGMLPMTFGHSYTRVAGLERVCRVPAELGYVKQPLTPELLNPYPHPFP
ncbi:TOMM precursor leader peptide-binding protein [Paenibacillus puerhi]|uniref:TOMM precursor leader peptide-binding protein n=1 Tax=Paenibacillus puerhi TaxID=2692622 RepID=UPI00135BE501|nr:TOMM precursor leader peptide-binding protein [Paenibacillus puerhi]